MTLGIVKQTENDLGAWLATEEGFVSGLLQHDGEPITLEAYQLAFLRSRSRFRWVTKSRQVGYSFLIACEALARCHLRHGYTAVIISYNLEDAKEKIIAARALYEGLPIAYQKRLVTDSKTELVFESNASKKPPSRILSLPSRAPRGRKGDIYLDEMAHYLDDREVYTGSTALILRSSGQLSACSSPLGRRGIFHEVATQTGRYRHHWRQSVAWWLCSAFCHDVRRAAREAPHLPTEERVTRYGKAAIVEQFEALPRDDFQQEFECSFLDESASFYPYDLILPCQDDGLVLANDVTDIPRPSGRLLAGYDVGRTRDHSALAVFEEIRGRYVCRMLKSHAGMAFDAQETELRRLLSMLPVARLSIDRGGLGMHMAENLSRDFPQVVPENLTNESKERMALDFKLLLQSRNLELPRDRGLLGEIHSVERRILPSGKIAFEAPRSARGGHADRFWAVALACQRERGPAPVRPTSIGVRIIG